MRPVWSVVYVSASLGATKALNQSQIEVKVNQVEQMSHDIHEIHSCQTLQDRSRNYMVLGNSE